MDNKNDPRILIYSNLDNVQKDLEDTAKDRISEIKNEAKEQKDSLKSGVKDLKQEAKDSYNEYKEYKKDSGDPLASEKISTAKEAHKVVEKGIENDYQQTVDQIDREAEHRINSINNMLDDSKEA